MTIWLTVDGKKRRVDVPAGAVAGAMECSIDGQPVTVEAQLLQPGVLSLLIAGRQYRCVLDGDAVAIAGQRFAFERDDPRSLQGRRGAGAGAAGPRALKASMPGRVVRVLAAAGDDVAEGQGLVVIEAMKMQNELKSPKAGRLIGVAVAVDDTVGAGDVLAVVD